MGVEFMNEPLTYFDTISVSKLMTYMSEKSPVTSS